MINPIIGQSQRIIRHTPLTSSLTVDKHVIGPRLRAQLLKSPSSNPLMSQSTDMVVPECCVCHAKIAGYKTCPNCMSLQCTDCHDFVGQCGTYACESHPNQVSITDKKESPASLEKVVESPSVDLKSLQQLQEIQKRVDTYNLKPTCCTPRTIEYLAWFEVASCCQESDWVNLDTQLQCKSGWELEQLDQLTLARIGKVSIDKTGPRSTLYIERLTHYTQVCKDLFTVGRFVDTVEVSKESQNQDLQSRVTFAVGSRYRSVKLWAQACDAFLEGSHYAPALDMCINVNLLDEPRIYKVFDKMREQDNGSLYAARALDNIISRLNLLEGSLDGVSTKTNLSWRTWWYGIGSVEVIEVTRSNLSKDFQSLRQTHYEKAQSVLEQQHDYTSSYHLAIEFNDEQRIKKYAQLSGTAKTLLLESKKIDTE